MRKREYNLGVIENTIFVDPATRRLGWAVFMIDHDEGRAWLRDSGGVEQHDENWEKNADDMVTAVWATVCEWECERCVIEMPEAFNSERSTGAMGSVLKLACFVGQLKQGMKEGGVAVELVPVRKWKGTVPKRVTQVRVGRSWGWRGRDNNEADAVGIGDWYVRKHLRFEAVRTRTLP